MALDEDDKRWIEERIAERLAELDARLLRVFDVIADHIAALQDDPRLLSLKFPERPYSLRDHLTDEVRQNLENSYLEMRKQIDKPLSD